MTILICRHHYYFGLWIILGTFFFYGMMINTYFLTHDQPTIDDRTPYKGDYNKDSFSWELSKVGFIVCSFFFGLVNFIGLYYGNEKYHWIGLKDCNK